MVCLLVCRRHLATLICGILPQNGTGSARVEEQASLAGALLARRQRLLDAITPRLPIRPRRLPFSRHLPRVPLALCFDRSYVRYRHQVERGQCSPSREHVLREHVLRPCSLAGEHCRRHAKGALLLFASTPSVCLPEATRFCERLVSSPRAWRPVSAH